MRFLSGVLLVFLLSSCVGRTVTPVIEENVVIEDPLRVRAQEITSSLDNRLLASQVLISGIEDNNGMSVKMIELFTAIPTGGIMLFKYNLNTDNDAIKARHAQFKSLIKKGSNIPPFFAVDHEGGTVNRFRRGVADLPNAASYYENISQGREETLAAIEADSLKAGREIHNLGINMNFAPVAEYLFEGNLKFLSKRSYGPDPFFTAQAAEAFIRGMEQAKVLCVVKHFPASAGPNPHYSPSVLDMDRAALNNLVLPFASLIKNGTRAIMAAHTLAPAIDDKIASLSSVVMGNWLRGDLGFDGIIISDDFIMAAAGSTSPEEAAVLSIAAGSDMILVWPDNLPKTHQAILTALEDGRLPRARLQDAAQRVIYEKLRMGLIDE